MQMDLNDYKGMAGVEELIKDMKCWHSSLSDKTVVHKHHELAPDDFGLVYTLVRPTTLMTKIDNYLNEDFYLERTDAAGNHFQIFQQN